ncbi:hypothetical protein ACFY8W_25120 [Streptomyces sp. NPDC012637]|uniref:hypothetical protein n=1 Tax=Streptomyces sp. NPDC012637 TaxID=3364842 RepID=UPI0036E90626
MVRRQMRRGLRLARTGALVSTAGTPGVTPPCGGYAEIDHVFVRGSALAGPYGGDSLAVPTVCTGVAACSDHRLLVGTVTVG